MSEARGLAVVTGASSGIGACFAERLAARGLDLLVVARRKDRLEESAARLERQHGVAVRVRALDLTDAAALAELEAAVSAEPRLEMLVNNAGFGTVRLFKDIEADRLEAEIRLNAIAVSRLTRAALPGMIARGRGFIINVSSSAGFQPGPYFANYAATKAFVTSLTDALAAELEGTGVRVQALCPGPVSTEFSDVAGIEEEKLPRALLQTAAEVVDASLAGLERGQPVCTTSMAMKVSAVLTGVLPRSVSRSVYMAIARRTFAST